MQALSLCLLLVHRRVISGWVTGLTSQVVSACFPMVRSDEILPVWPGLRMDLVLQGETRVWPDRLHFPMLIDCIDFPGW